MAKPKKRTTTKPAPSTTIVTNAVNSEIPDTLYVPITPMVPNTAPLTKISNKKTTAATATEMVYIQFQETEITQKDVIERVKQAFTNEGNQEKDINTLDAYVKPEERKIYFVINHNYTGTLDY